MAMDGEIRPTKERLLEAKDKTLMRPLLQILMATVTIVLLVLVVGSILAICIISARR